LISITIKDYTYL